MPSLADYVDRYPGRRFVIVGKGRTRFDYDRLSETTDPVIFLNDAVQLAPIARRSSERFFFAHDARQAVWLPGLEATAVLAEAPDAEESRTVHPHNQRLFACNLALADRPANLVTYRWGGRMDINDDVAEYLDQLMLSTMASDGRLLIGLGGTIHTALHFAWLSGAREIAFIGCDGRPDGYDPRLAIRSGAPDLGVQAKIRANQDRLCRRLGLEAEYVEERLEPLIPRLAHFAWLNGDPPAWVQEAVREFREKNPGWEVRLWPDLPPDVPTALGPALAGCWQECQRADILYCLVLDRFGGVVLDCDHLVLRSFEPLRRGREAWTTSHNDLHRRLTNGAMGAVAGSRAFRRALAAIPWIHRKGGRDGRVRRCAYGPDMLTQRFSNRGDRDLQLLPWHYFYPYSCQEAPLARRLRGATDAERRQALEKIQGRFSDGQWPYTVHLWGVEGSSQKEVAHAKASA